MRVARATPAETCADKGTRASKARARPRRGDVGPPGLTPGVRTGTASPEAELARPVTPATEGPAKRHRVSRRGGSCPAPPTSTRANFPQRSEPLRPRTVKRAVISKETQESQVDDLTVRLPLFTALQRREPLLYRKGSPAVVGHADVGGRITWTETSPTILVMNRCYRSDALPNLS